MTTIRPSRSAYLRAIGINTAIGGLLVVTTFVRAYRTPSLWVGIAITVAACLSLVVIYFSTARVVFGGGEYRWSRWLRTTRFVAGDVLVVVLVPNYRYTLGQASAPYLFVVGIGGRRLLKLGGTFWALGDEESVAADLAAHGATVERIDEPVDRSALTDRYPYLRP